LEKAMVDKQTPEISSEWFNIKGESAGGVKGN
jgi:hypothetical protein